ncbi:putative allantoin catabolism protein [Variovorax sp. PBL-H6]|uniref:cupin domain-containing protein n=1 Tax=Variovorax sp. PBL-H6 TaxID=434009 RepID=UPI001316C260|nr:cupin domain-containing protein [Variovorax sp. PBL-H6]VTU15119.1 putative allantoin catabolism protein [Variovorax sp. PBL-H6]
MTPTDDTRQAMTPGAKRAGPGEYLFNMNGVNQIMGGPAYSPVFGSCVEGDRMIVALMRYPKGKPSDRHSHPNEQWIYVLEGVLEMEFDGTVFKAGPGDCIYVPANKMHLAANNGDKDVIFFTCKDTSHGLHGIKAPS